MPTQRQRPSSSDFFNQLGTESPVSKKAKPPVVPDKVPSETAIVYCEGNFGTIDGKMTNGLVRHSEKYKILSIIDNENEGQDAGEILDGKPNGIPVYRDLGTSLAHAGRAPTYLIFGIAPASGMLSPAERRLILRAMKYGMNIVSELHEFLNNDPEFAAACAKFEVVIRDI